MDINQIIAAIERLYTPATTMEGAYVLREEVIAILREATPSSPSESPSDGEMLEALPKLGYVQAWSPQMDGTSSWFFRGQLPQAATFKEALRKAMEKTL